MSRFMDLLSDAARMRYEQVRTLSAYRGASWREIPVVECGEALVQVSPDHACPYYADVMRLTTDRRVFLRKQVYGRFLSAQGTLLREGYDLKVFDGWRSIKVQEALFWHYLREFTAAKFNLKDRFAGLSIPEVRAAFESLPETRRAMLREANQTYVSWPSKDWRRPSPHATGGAVDVWLYEDGKPVNLGAPFDWMEENAGAFYHLKWKRARFQGNDPRICFRRERLLLAMVRAGFTAYGPEFWHFNLGNQMDALVRGGHATYSYMEPDQASQHE